MEFFLLTMNMHWLWKLYMRLRLGARVVPY